MAEKLNEKDLELLIEAVEEYSLAVEDWTHPVEKLKKLHDLLGKLKDLPHKTV